MNWTRIEELVEEGYINKTKHPLHDLWIYNYSVKTQFDSNWVEETMICRGLVADANHKVWARPFPKFFNVQQLPWDSFPKEPFQVFEKVDGSLGIVFNYNGTIIFASRGSFASDQAIEMSKIWEEKYSDVPVLPGRTYLFEIIYPENRIVLDYGDMRDLIALSIVEEDGSETLPPYTTSTLPGFLPFPFPQVKTYHFDSFEEALKIDKSQEEGYVLRFQSGLRTKIKFSEYCRLHSVITNTSTTSVWEVLMTGGDYSQFIENVPDEFYQWVKDTTANFRAEFAKLEASYRTEADKVLAMNFGSRKELAAHVLVNYPKDFGFIFAMIDGKDMSEAIWKKLKPVYSKPFWNKSVEEA